MTANVRPFRFTVQCSSPETVTRAGWAQLARQCESSGYHALTVSDHLDEQVAPGAALMAAADATSTLRIGSMAFCNDFRHPVALAKEAATLDVLSGGRFELGIGAGWLRTDYDRAGIDLDPPGRRIERLGEAVKVLKGLFAEGPFSFEGRYYHIRSLDGTPKPLQRPNPPIFIGGGGRRMLSLAAREADVVGLNPAMVSGAMDSSVGPDATAAATERKLAWVKEAAGERWADIEIQARVHAVVVTDDRAGVASALAGAFGLSADDALGSPHALCGTVDQIVDDLVYRRERYGINVFGVPADALGPFAPVVERLAGR